MSAENCPFVIIRPSRSDDEKKDDTFIKFELPIDPDDADGLKSNILFKKLDSDDPEDVLSHVRNFQKLASDLDTAEGAPRFRLFSMTLSIDIEDDWNSFAQEVDKADRDQDAFDECMASFVLSKVDRDCALDTKEWLQSIKKPRTWTVKKFMQRLKAINNLIPHMPLPEEEAEEEARIEPFSDAELRNILKKASPQSWSETQIKSNLRFDTTSAQVTYYEKLRNLEDKNSGSVSRAKSDKSNNNRPSNKNRNNGGNKHHGSDGNTPCPIHGPGHTVSQCKVINQEKQKFKQNKNSGARRYGNNSNNNNNYRRGNNSSCNNGNNGNNGNHNRYNNNNVHRRTDQNNNIEQQGSNPNSGSDDDAAYEIEEEIHVLNDSDIDIAIEKAVPAPSPSPTAGQTKSAAPSISTDVCVEFVEVTDHLQTKTKSVIGLLDSGAFSTFVTWKALKYVNHSIRNANVTVKGQYAKAKVTSEATFKIKLPDFASSKIITCTALVEDKSIGRHGIVFGTKFLQDLGVVFDYKKAIVTWDDVAISMKRLDTTNTTVQSLDEVDPADEHLPDFMKKATVRQVSLPKRITANEYETYNYKDMVLKCNHLSPEQKDQLIVLFSQYTELFSGHLGSVPGPPVKLKIKPGSVPFCSRAYTVPKAYEEIAKKEIQELIDIGVLVQHVHSAWGSPSFFRPKKNGGVRFVSDLRKLNACLEHHPFPLPVIEDVVWKINGFKYATCLDLNRGYYHFRLDEESMKYCRIVLPWGTYAYARLPQGLMPSSDIFQSRMMEIFGEMVDVIIYIDNILIFTKECFKHHLERLAIILQKLLENNLHVHVEETFLASTSVDYLGYTLTTDGIKPQIKKILPILRFSTPATVRQLCAFLGLVNYYKKLYHHRSHFLEPLTQVSSSNTKFKLWGPEQDAAFAKMKRLVARQVLLHFPDFSKPFWIYTDVSDYQLGGVIAQDNFPVAFYSRKLNSAQRNYTTMEKELLSIVETVVYHRGILLGFKIFVGSDHKNLSFDSFKSERVRRWRLLLEEYDYKFSYVPGKDNVVADMISRYPMFPVESIQVIEDMANVEEEEEFPLDFSVISRHQANDQQIQAQLNANSPGYSQRYVHNYQLTFRNSKIVVPADLIESIISWYHINLNHPGINRTYSTISQHFCFKSMKRLITEHVKSCQICLEQKRAHVKFGKLPPAVQVTSSQPWDTVHVDLFGPWSFECRDNITHQLQGVSFIDASLRWIELHPYESKRSEDVSLQFDREWLCRYPRPRFVVYDNGTEFSSEFCELLLSYGIEPKPATVKNPQANGIVERVHQTIADSIRAMNLASRPFDDTSIHGILQSIAWGIRSTYHTALRSSPGQLAFGRDMIVPATYLANWRHIHSNCLRNVLYDNARENRSRIDHDYHVNDMVYITNNDIKRKLSPSKKGPFCITQVHTNGTVTIQRSTHVTERINIRRLYPSLE